MILIFKGKKNIRLQIKEVEQSFLCLVLFKVRNKAFTKEMRISESGTYVKFLMWWYRSKHYQNHTDACSSVFFNWASEANPTLGCSIAISHDIYIYVCRFVYGKPIQKIRMPKMRGRNYVAQTRAC